VDEIRRFNRTFPPVFLDDKLGRLTDSAFGFFRGTFHLFARDIIEGPFRKLPVAASRGRIVGDLHTENFGTFRAVTGEIVYDVNDFDETTVASYENDLRRLSTSLLLAALDRGLRLGDGVNAAEHLLRSYVKTLGLAARFQLRSEFEQMPEL